MTKHKGSRIHKHNQVQHVKQSVHIHLDTRKKHIKKKKARAFRPTAVLQLPPVNRVINNHIVLPDNAGRPALGFFQQQAVKAQEVAQSNLVKQIKTGLAEPEKKQLADTNKIDTKTNDIADDAVKDLEGVFDKSPRTPEQLTKAKQLFPNRRSFPKDYDKIEKLISSAPPHSQQPTASSSSRTQVDEYDDPSLFTQVTKKS
tara:strand:- start:7107 stop:7709 length:603 start_codon:yes stop_codon:yes gene_type:complete